LTREAPALGVSLLLAEIFYRFHSFSLECIAFLLTWAALSWVQARVFGRALPS